MQTFTLSFDTVNAAFVEAPQQEVARILRRVASEVEWGMDGYNAILDVNGNTVGNWQWIEKREEPR